MHKLKHNLYRYFHENLRLLSGSPFTQVNIELYEFLEWKANKKKLPVALPK